MSIFSLIWVQITGFLLGLWSFVQLGVVYRVRLREYHAGWLIEKIKSEGSVFFLNQEITQDHVPREFRAMVYWKGFVFYISTEERLLKAGLSATDIIVHITGLRLQRKKFLAVVTNKKQETKLAAYLLGIWDIEKLCDISSPENFHKEIYPLYDEIDSEILSVKLGKRKKTGILLYGGPGNGKSYLIKHLAIKHELPIYIVSLDKFLQNKDILRMFSRLREPAIVVLEDFDNVFDKRQCLLPECSLTLDGILNVLDGAFLDLSGIVFIMTANNLSKIDYALKNRPSRFRIVTDIQKPSYEMKTRFLPPHLAKLDISVDEMFFVKENREKPIFKIEEMLLSLREKPILNGQVKEPKPESL